MALLMLLLVVGTSFFLLEFPDTSLLKTHYPVIFTKGFQKPKVFFVKNRPLHWVSLNEVSDKILGAILVSEDWAFYHHKGLDPNQIKKALEINWKKGRFVRGASTITQQVVRNVFLTKDKNLWRKFKEIILALRLEKELSKNKILEIYLNIAEWGNGLYGIDLASQYYFSKHPYELTAREGAFLAVLLPSPKKYSRTFKEQGLTEFAFHRMNDILQKMTQAQYLTPEEYEEEVSEPLVLN
ncbi:MAG: transglycosylase domain-containing protein [Deltaproteobacteria bacterium]|nr:transglycosylase domain-containing protein [Deltaproteobacteria bacterium]